MNWWQFVTIGPLSISRNKFAKLDISSVCKMVSFWLRRSVRLTRNKIWKQNIRECYFKCHLLLATVTLLPSRKRQSQILSTVSIGRTSANKQINHFVVMTANGSPNWSKRWFISGTRLFSSSLRTSMSIMRPVIVFVWYDVAISSTIIFNNQNVHSSSLVTIRIKPISSQYDLVVVATHLYAQKLTSYIVESLTVSHVFVMMCICN